MMSYFVGISRREARTLGASDISGGLCVVSAQSVTMYISQNCDNNAERLTS